MEGNEMVDPHIFYLPAIGTLDYILMNIQTSSPIDYFADILTNLYKLLTGVSSLWTLIWIVVEIFKPTCMFIMLLLILIPHKDLIQIYCYLIQIFLAIILYLLIDLLLLFGFSSLGSVKYIVCSIAIFLFVHHLIRRKHLFKCNNIITSADMSVQNSHNGGNHHHLFYNYYLPNIFSQHRSYQFFLYVFIAAPIILGILLITHLNSSKYKKDIEKGSQANYLISDQIFNFPTGIQLFQYVKTGFSSVIRQKYEKKAPVVIIQQINTIKDFSLNFNTFYSFFNYILISAFYTCVTSIFIGKILIFQLGPHLFSTIKVYFENSHEQTRISGLTYWVESEWNRIRIPKLFKIYWFIRTFTILFPLLFYKYSIDTIIPLPNKNNNLFVIFREVLLIRSCDSFLTIITSSAILCQLSNLMEKLFYRNLIESNTSSTIMRPSSNTPLPSVGSITTADTTTSSSSSLMLNDLNLNRNYELNNNNNNNNHNIGKTIALIFVISAAQTGLTNIQSHDIKLDRLGRNLVLTCLATMHYVHDIIIAPKIAILALKTPPTGGSSTSYYSSNLLTREIKIIIFTFCGFVLAPLFVFLIPLWHLQLLWQPETRDFKPRACWVGYETFFKLTPFPISSNHLNTWLISVTILCTEICVKTSVTLVLYATRKLDSLRNGRITRQFLQSLATTTTSPTISSSSLNDQLKDVKTCERFVNKGILCKTFECCVLFVVNILISFAYAFHLHKLGEILPFMKPDANSFHTLQNKIQRCSNLIKSKCRAFIHYFEDKYEEFMLFICNNYDDRTWECKLDKIIWRITCFGNVWEFACGVELFLNAVWILVFESNGMSYGNESFSRSVGSVGGGGSAVRATMTLLHFYFNLWIKGREGLSAVERRFRVRRIMKDLSHSIIPQSSRKTETTDDKFCPICRTELVVDVLKTPCGHVYHNYCLQKWLYKKDDCPMCRFHFHSK